MGARFRTLINVVPFTPYQYEGERTSCNLCGCDGADVVSRYDRRLKVLVTVACVQCGLLRTDPMLTKRELEAYYAAAYRRDYAHTLCGTPSKAHIARGRREAAERLEILQLFLAPGSRILDVGSGAGIFLATAQAAGYSVTGLEPGQEFAAYCRDTLGIDVAGGDWDAAQFERGSFQVITARHVLEHLREPLWALKRMSAWLAPDGVIYVSVPNIEGQRRHAFQHFHFAHVHHFTRGTLIEAGRVAGLEEDERVTLEGTRIVFRKRRLSDSGMLPDRVRSRGMLEINIGVTPMVYLLTGRWLFDAVRRLRRRLRMRDR